MKRTIHVLLALLCSVPLLAACSAKRSASSTGGPGWQEEEEFDDSEATGAARGAEPSILDAIYFDYDSPAIRRDQLRTLEANASALKSGPWARVVVAGHCDERGSDEYNLALGERRAHAVRQRLVDLGVDGARLETVSYGESRPAVLGSVESAWRMNRRVEFFAAR